MLIQRSGDFIIDYLCYCHPMKSQYLLEEITIVTSNVNYVTYEVNNLMALQDSYG